MSSENVSRRRDEKLQNIIEYAYTNVPFYINLWEKKHIGDNIEDKSIENVPVIDKTICCSAN